MATQCHKLIICFLGHWAEEETRSSGSTLETKTEEWWGCKTTSGWDPENQISKGAMVLLMKLVFSVWSRKLLSVVFPPSFGSLLIVYFLQVQLQHKIKQESEQFRLWKASREKEVLQVNEKYGRISLNSSDEKYPWYFITPLYNRLVFFLPFDNGIAIFSLFRLC